VYGTANRGLIKDREGRVIRATTRLYAGDQSRQVDNVGAVIEDWRVIEVQPRDPSFSQLQRSSKAPIRSDAHGCPTRKSRFFGHASASRS